MGRRLRASQYWENGMVKGKQTIELGGRYPDEVLLDGLLEVLDVRIPFGEVHRLEGVVGRA